MRHQKLKSAIAGLAATAVLSVGLMNSASAGLVSTQQVINQAERHSAIARVEARLAEAAVADQLAALGVDQQALQARVNELTHEELLQLDGQIEHHIAGGDAVSLVGAVFIVLLVLELVGVIDIFKGA